MIPGGVVEPPQKRVPYDMASREKSGKGSGYETVF